MRIRTSLITILILSMGSCIKEPVDSGKGKVSAKEARVAVLCEGNFMWNNAQLDIYNPDSNSLWSNAFEAVNNRPIGDVLQSGLLYGNTLWLVVNNSGLLVGVNPQTLKVKHQVNAGKSPRFAAAYEGKLYISDLENNAVTVLDTQSLSTRTLPVRKNATGTRVGWTEHIIEYNNYIVSAVYDGYIWVYDPQTDISKLITCSKGAQFLSIDAQNRLWVGASDADSSSLTCLNANFTVTERVEFPPKNNLTRMCLSRSRDSLWMLVGGNLQCCDLRNPTKSIFVPVVPYTMGYGLAVNPQNGDIYVTDAYDYIRKGRVVILNAGADSVKNSFFSGIIPSNFVFLPQK
jgi:DNA-binding beta-propeller fold protein YncE